MSNMTECGSVLPAKCFFKQGGGGGGGGEDSRKAYNAPKFMSESYIAAYRLVLAR